MNARLLVALTATLITAGVALGAHHSFASTYDESKNVKIEGKLVQFLFRNPDSFVHVMAPDEQGQTQRWSVEWGGAGQLAGQGVSRDTLKPGDAVAISGNPGRNPADHRIRMRTLRRLSDGFGWGAQPGETFD